MTTRTPNPAPRGAKAKNKAAPYSKYAPDEGVDLFQCNRCFHITDEDNYDVGGSDLPKLFCNQCGHHGVPCHVGWMRESFLYPKKKPALAADRNSRQRSRK